MMNDNPTSDARFERLGEHLDDLAARATRAVAELRVQSQSILDDVATWKEHLDVARVDAELARMDAADDLRRARAAWSRHYQKGRSAGKDFRKKRKCLLRPIRPTPRTSVSRSGHALPGAAG